jgi:hypothetical protein
MMKKYLPEQKQTIDVTSRDRLRPNRNSRNVTTHKVPTNIDTIQTPNAQSIPTIIQTNRSALNTNNYNDNQGNDPQIQQSSPQSVTAFQSTNNNTT